MTSAAQDWRTMPAGRELDAVVAERVLGWTGRAELRKRGATATVTGFRHTGVPGRGVFDMYYTEDGTKLYCGQPWAPHFPGYYSSNIAAAWQVMDAMIARGLRPSLCMWNDGTWICDGHWDDLHGDQSADTPALAICRAALAFMEGQHP